MRNKYLFFFLSIIISVILFIPVNAYDIDDINQTDITSVIDLDEPNNILYQSNNYSNVNNYYENNNNGNLAIVKNGKVIKTSKAIAFFDQTDCNTNVEFTYINSGDSGYTNGCYGIDSAYIQTSDTGNTVVLKISGSLIRVNRSLVTLIPLSYLDTNLSYYRISDNKIYHMIKTNRNNNLYANSILLGQAPEYLTDDTYYSYDGHYFYNDIETMLNNYQNDTNINSINADNPYYNYYQYVSHRSFSNVTVNDLNNYFKDYLNINNYMNEYIDLNSDSSNDIISTSNLYNSGDSFISNQYLYHTNALMMVALSLNESNNGTSALSYTRNNLFGHAAYDFAVEKYASRYASIYSSIRSHAKNYINDAYCNSDNFTYHGCYFGNKESGMNVSYASDPYWGEKAASYYYRLDTNLNTNDNTNYQLVIINNIEGIDVYSSPDSSSDILYTIKQLGVNSFTVINNYDNWLAIIADVNGNNNEIGYIKKDNIITYLNSDTKDINLDYKVTLDANGGSFIDGSSIITYNTIDKDHIGLIQPTYSGYKFIDYTVDSSDEDSIVYKANYKKIDSIQFNNLPKTIYDLNEKIDLTQGTLLISYVDNSSEVVNLYSTDISGFNTYSSGQHRVIVNYQGNSLSYLIEVKQEIDDTYQQIRDTINNTINYGSATSEQLNTFKQVIDNAVNVPILSFTQYRQFESINNSLLHDNGFKVWIDDTDNLAVTNLNIALNLNHIKANSSIDDVIGVYLENIDSDTSLYNGYIKQGCSVYKDYQLNIKHNFKTINNNDIKVPLIISVDRNDNDNTSYIVLNINDNKVTLCKNEVNDNSISFLADGSGEYVILAIDSYQSISNNTTIYETYNNNNSDINIYDLENIKQIIIIISILILVIILLLIVILIRFINRFKYKKNKYKKG